MHFAMPARLLARARLGLSRFFSIQDSIFKQSDIIGIRWNCMACEDFDLCGECYSAGSHFNHRELMVAIETPGNIDLDMSTPTVPPPSFSKASDPPPGWVKLTHGNYFNNDTRELAESLPDIPARLYDAEEPEFLPEKWERRYTNLEGGRTYYANLKAKSTTWIHPIAVPELPEGWDRSYDEEGEVYYINRWSKTTTTKHPLRHSRKCAHCRNPIIGTMYQCACKACYKYRSKPVRLASFFGFSFG